MFARRDMVKYMARGNIAWLTGSDVRVSNNFAWVSTITSHNIIKLGGVIQGEIPSSVLKTIDDFNSFYK